MKMKKNCRVLPDGRIEFQGHDTFKLPRTFRMDEEGAIEWIRNCASKHVVYVIKGKEYSREGG